MDKKVKHIIENKQIRDRLHEAGVYPVRGIQGPQGIKGEKGDQGEPGQKGPTGPSGKDGISETIVIDKVETVEPEETASVQDEIKQNTHHLTLRIPKGKTGETGPQGSIGMPGPTGPMGPVGPLAPVSCSALIFVSYMNATEAKAMAVGNTRVIPGYTNTFVIENGTDIKINKTSVYEITLCGKISGVTQNTGASFHLINKEDSGAIVNDLTFELPKGDVSFMDFSELCFADITAPASLQVKTNIDGNDTTIKFSEVNVLIKEYNV